MTDKRAINIRRSFHISRRPLEPHGRLNEYGDARLLESSTARGVKANGTEGLFPAD